MASKTITQLTALDTVSTNLANTLFVVYDTETGSTKKASLSQIDSAVERSMQNVTITGVYANAAFAKANIASANPIMLEPLSGLTIEENFTIPNNYKGVSRGTVTLNNNVTVTISGNAEWFIDN
jgi:hypothetical protein